LSTLSQTRHLGIHFKLSHLNRKISGHQLYQRIFGKVKSELFL